MLAREAGEFEGQRRGARLVVAHQFEHRRVHFPISERADMAEARNPFLHAVDERNRAIDLAERPGRKRKIDHRGDTRKKPFGRT